MLRRLAIVVSIVLAPAASAQNFSCGIGDRGACLGYGDTVCSSQGKCVNNNALCFDQFQCDYEGFTCKSNVTACVNDYNDLLARRNALADDYTALFERNEDLVDAYGELLDTNNELVGDYNSMLEDFNGLRAEYQDLFSQYENVLADYENALERLSEVEAERDILEDQVLRGRVRRR